MAAKTYWEKLKDPRWQKRRLEVLQMAKFTCEMCGSTKDTLHVHHGYYGRKMDPWEYDLTTLHVLCEECHDYFGRIQGQINRAMGCISPWLLNKKCLDAVIMQVTPSREHLRDAAIMRGIAEALLETAANYESIEEIFQKEAKA